MSVTRRETILLSTGTYDWKYLERNSAAATAIKPGTMMQRNAADAFIPFPTVGGVGVNYVAREDSLQGKTIDDAYAAGNPVFAAVPVPGAVAQVLLTFGVAYAIGDILIHAGDGSLKKTALTPLQYVAVIEEAISLVAPVVNTLGTVRFVA